MLHQVLASSTTGGSDPGLSFAQALVVGITVGVVTGGLAIIGVLITAGKAATAAAAADVRRAKAAEAADARRSAAEHQRWSREKRLAAYADFIASVETWKDQSIDRSIQRRVSGKETLSATELLEGVRKAGRSATVLKLLASESVNNSAGELIACAVEIANLSSMSPPTEASVVDGAKDRYYVAYHKLMREIRHELDITLPRNAAE
jgi:hypothetical protein